MQQLLSNFEDVFAEPKSLPPIRSLDHQIPLKTGFVPPNQRPYRYPYVQMVEIERLIKEMIDVGIIQDSKTLLPPLDSGKEEGWELEVLC